MILMYPIITRKVGIDAFGLVMLTNAFAGVAGILINYGTNQTGIKDIAAYTNYRGKLSVTFYTSLWMRLLIFFAILVLMTAGLWLSIPHYDFYLLAVPLIAAEVINPLFFYLGKQWLSTYNIANILSKIAIITLILVFINQPEDARWVNFCMGTVSFISYALLLIYALNRFKVPFSRLRINELKLMAHSNFYLTANNISVHLQQSIMLFVLARWGNLSLLGAYSLCDKVIWSSRILIMSVSNALYPKAAQLANQDMLLWASFRNRAKKMISLGFLAFSIALFVFARLIIKVLAGEENLAAESFLRIMAFVPAVAAFNSLNVTELLLMHRFNAIFRIAMVLLVIAALLSVLLVNSAITWLIATYALLVELCALLLYEFVIRQKTAFEG